MARYKKRDKRTNSIDFWQSSTDLMTALILVLLLVIMLLVLFIIQIPEDFRPDVSDRGSHVTADADGSGNSGGNRSNSHDSSGGAGDGQEGDGGDGGGEGTDVGEYPEETHGVKSAVLVTMVDAQTGKAIKEKGIAFELYSKGGSLQTLNTYYPRKQSFRKYETTSKGSFYLPEKVYLDEYYLTQLTQIKGYDLADRVEFNVDEERDWSNPIAVKVPMYPSRDIIRLQQSDADSGQVVPGGVYEIKADEDIITRDGTVRSHAGDLVGTIRCDENGYGESKRLYLGSYTVSQKQAPRYYALHPKTIRRELTEKSAATNRKDKHRRASSIDQIRLEKTEITLCLQDELTGEPIEGIDFSLTSGGRNETLTTDGNGQFVVTDLDKNAEYSLQQLASSEHYRITEETIRVKVSGKGLIKNKAKSTVTATNRLLRLHVNVRDAVIGNSLANIDAELYSEGGRKLKTWTTAGSAAEITDLEPGDYYLILDGNKDKKYPLAVEDTAAIQDIDIRLFTVRSYLAIGAGSILGAALLYGVYRLIARRRRRRAAEAQASASAQASETQEPQDGDGPATDSAPDSGISAPDQSQAPEPTEED